MPMTRLSTRCCQACGDLALLLLVALSTSQLTMRHDVCCMLSEASFANRGLSTACMESCLRCSAQVVAGRAVECRENVPQTLDMASIQRHARHLLGQVSSWQYVMQSRL